MSAEEAYRAIEEAAKKAGYTSSPLNRKGAKGEGGRIDEPNSEGTGYTGRTVRWHPPTRRSGDGKVPGQPYIRVNQPSGQGHDPVVVPFPR